VKELTKKETTEIAEAQFFDMTGYTGYENVDRESLTIPFLRIAQPMTAQVSEDDPSYIDGLKVGHFYNTAAGKSYGKEVRMIILGYSRSFTIWGSEIGDFKGVCSVEEFRAKEPSLTRDGSMFIDPDGLRYQDTRNFFVLLPDHPEDGVILYPLKGAGISPSKKVLTRATSVRKDAKQVPLFASIWNVSTVKVQNDQGSWYEIGDRKTLAVTWDGFVPTDLQSVVMDAVGVVTDYMKQATSINYGVAGEDTPVESEEF